MTLMSVSLLLGGIAAEAQPNGKAKRKRRPNPALAPIEDVEGLPRVLLVGDSISIGYTLPVRAKLAGKANVHRIRVNGGPTKRGVQRLDKWLGKGDWDVIHFNWGLHDLKRMPDGKHQVPIDEYEKNLRILVDKLKATDASLIWCATTPVPEGDLKPPRSNADVIAYNKVAASVMEENDIAVNDLYSYALPKLQEIQRPANVHFTAEGSKVLADKVAEVILDALEK